jgi:sigma-B regulation protein RsbU (phosphoserine phosphatase)
MFDTDTKRKITWRMKRWLPKSKLGKFTLYVVFLRLVVFVIDQSLKLAGNGGSAGGWSILLNFILGLCVIVLGLRWFRQRFLWKVRNKMILTYLFIGLVPVFLVVLMAFFAGYLFLNQYATSQARSEIEEEVKRLEVVNAGAATELEEQIDKGAQINEKLGATIASVRHHDQRFPGWQLVYWVNGKPVHLHGGGALAHEAEEPEWSKGEYQGIVVDENKLFLRAAVAVQSKNAKGHLVSSVPITGKMLDKLANDIGVIQIFLPRLDQSGKNNNALHITTVEGNEKKSFLVSGTPDVSGGSLPSLAQGSHAFEMNFASLYPYKDLSSKQASLAVIQLRTRPDILVNRLFANSGVFASIILNVLGGTAIFFGIIVLLASFFGFGLMRTITYAVHNLYEGTQHVNRGNFKHRIEVRSKDQLAALQTSFNQMSESIERLILEHK